jgi:glyoxylase I family protein
MSEIRGVSHINLSVRDLDASLSFYRDVLGLTVLMEPFEGVVFAGREAMVMAGQVAIGLQEHRANDGAEFSPTRTGLDHLAFHVSSIADLDAWMARLDSHGIEHSAIRPVAFGSMIEFRDPDGVQLEIFALTGLSRT